MDSQAKTLSADPSARDLRADGHQEISNWWRLPLLAGSLGVICLVLLDVPLASWIKFNKVPGELKNLLDAGEHFGTPYGQLMILLTLISVGCLSWPRATRIFLGTVAAGLSANVLKLMVARSRPRVIDFEGFSVWESFAGAFPLGLGGSGIQSFPSAHTASAFGFAVMMFWAFPRGRVAFFVLAMLTALQRVCASAHFPSDVCFGAAIGWSVASLFVHWNRLAKPLERWEDHAREMGSESPMERNNVKAA